MSHTFLWLVAAGLVVSVLFVYFLRRKAASFYRLYREGVRCENKADYAGALDIYALLLEESRKMAFRDRQLMKEAEKRVKVLRAKLEEQIGFSQKLRYPF